MRDWPKHVTWQNIFQLKLGNIREYSPIFQTEHVAKKIWRIIKTIVTIWGENMLGYLSLDIICSSWLTVFLELHSRKTVRFSEQIMSADKYLSIFSRQMATIVYIFPNFQNCTRCEIDLKDTKHNSLYLVQKYARIFCPWTLSVPRSSLLGTDNVRGQMS